MDRVHLKQRQEELSPNRLTYRRVTEANNFLKTITSICLTKGNTFLPKLIPTNPTTRCQNTECHIINLQRHKNSSLFLHFHSPF